MLCGRDERNGKLTYSHAGRFGRRCCRADAKLKPRARDSPHIRMIIQGGALHHQGTVLLRMQGSGRMEATVQGAGDISLTVRMRAKFAVTAKNSGVKPGGGGGGWVWRNRHWIINAIVFRQLKSWKDSTE